MGYISDMTPFLNSMRDAKQAERVANQDILNITENGEYNVKLFNKVNVKVEGAGPVPPTPVLTCEKGDVIKMGGKQYRVLEANEDLTDVKLMTMEGVATAYNSDLSNTVEFSDGTTGQAYVNSTYEATATTYLEGLDEDIQAAIMEQELVQEIWTPSANEGEEDFSMTSFGGISYRYKKLGTAVVGNRKIAPIDFKDVLAYYDNPSVLTALQLLNLVSGAAWLLSASSSYSEDCFYVSGNVYFGYFAYNPASSGGLLVFTFHINLSSIEWTK